MDGGSFFYLFAVGKEADENEDNCRHKLEITMLTPSLEQFLERAAKKEHVPLRKKIPADLDTPVSAFLKLKKAGAAFLLESVERGIQVGRFSFIGISPYADISLQDQTVTIRKGGDIREAPVDADDPFSFVREELARSGGLREEELPGPFAGAVGYIGYDCARFFEKVPPPREKGLGLPDYRFLFPATLAVFDHVKSEIEILTLPPQGDPAEAYAVAREQIDSLLAALRSPLPVNGNPVPAKGPQPYDSNMSEEDFHRKVLQAKEHILAGDAFQIVLSQRLRGVLHTEPFQVYRALRILNPSPYMFFMDFGDYQVVGSSPEVLVKLEQRKATLAPIAGTRPRGANTTEDLQLEDDLLACEKERAEHVMLVDLGRNDLGRVCETGTIRPESLMHVEKYSHVMHIVSQITGRLREGLDMYDLLQAAFPAGTVTGAPKIRAMEIINDLEEDGRGPYAGAVGYFGRQGDMDMCITIRTLVLKANEYFAQAGAGIVADSDPAFEFQETLSKIQALISAVSIAEEGI
jgi:anthranilate synthase component I